MSILDHHDIYQAFRSNCPLDWAVTGSAHSSRNVCHVASLLANILPTTATTRQASVIPPTIYHHLSLPISAGIRLKTSAPIILATQEIVPKMIDIHNTGIGKMSSLMNVRRSWI